MLDEYKSLQPVAYKILKNAINKEKCSHAYLFETGDFSDSFKFILSFVKALQCPNKYTNNTNCSNCRICHMIESGNYPEIKIINPEGIWIKKEQLKELQTEFNKKAVLGNKKIYIINEADKLNKQSSNSILKFLEEPEEGIIAILITKNIFQILETIRSRCQIVKINDAKQTFTNETTIERLIKTTYQNQEIDEETINKIQKTINFINYYEKNHLKTILYMQKIWHNFIKTKEDLLKSFDIMILYYKDVLNNISNNKLETFNDYSKEITEISKNNTIKTIAKKISIILEYKEKINYNANTNLLMDKLLITLEGGVV